MTIAVIGYGDRGFGYAHYFRENGATVNAVCDTNEKKLKQAAEKFGLSGDRIFMDEDDFFAAGRLADLLIISTLDQLHYRQVLKAIEVGYDILLEKPIASTLEECKSIANAAKKHNSKVYLCYVLRYTPFFMKVKELIDSGVIGKVATINLTEGVGYWHQAHSYVRGNWRNSNESSPMIIAKCSHDMDMLYWLIDAEPAAVSSMGSLIFFNSNNAPEGAAKYCCDCKLSDTCPYNNFKFYSENPNWLLKLGYCDGSSDKEVIRKCLADKNNPYSRCVFHCDNNVVDHQITNIEFKNGVTAHLTMTAFAAEESRRIRVHGTYGEIYGSFIENKVYCDVYGKEKKVFDIEQIKGGNHGGGDVMMIRGIIDAYKEGRVIDKNGIEGAMCSHYLGFAAEESRLKGGEKIILK